MAGDRIAAVAPMADGGGPFDLINGIPVHALVVHAAVVLVPLVALGVLVMAFSPRFSRSLGWLVSLGAVAAFAATVVAKLAGEALVERVGEPGFDHHELGDLMPVFAAGLLVATVGLWLVDRSASDGGTGPRRSLRIGVAAAAGLVAVGNVVWVYRVGDSGAKSVWTGRVAASALHADGADPAGDDDAERDEDERDEDERDEDGEASALATYSLAEVASRATSTECWAVVEGSVYDLTDWIDEHPGGAQRITDLCGTDATAAFAGQHAGDEEPAEELAERLVGSIG
jgi:cytochrome b involved in lipid metabolism